MLSLRLDAIYCLTLGLMLIAGAAPVAATLDWPPALVLGVGVLVVVWAGLVEWMRARLSPRLSLTIVLIANVAATLAVACVSLTTAAAIAIVAVLAIAVDIALFATSQVVALRRIRAA